MFYYTTPYATGPVGIGGTNIIATHIQDGLIYVATLIKNEAWTEIAEADFLAARGSLPTPAPSQDERITQLEQVVDTMLGGGA